VGGVAIIGNQEYLNSSVGMKIAFRKVRQKTDTGPSEGAARWALYHKGSNTNNKWRSS
jgi:hypothetical protein